MRKPMLPLASAPARDADDEKYAKRSPGLRRTLSGAALFAQRNKAGLGMLAAVALLMMLLASRRQVVSVNVDLAYQTAIDDELASLGVAQGDAARPLDAEDLAEARQHEEQATVHEHGHEDEDEDASSDAEADDATAADAGVAADDSADELEAADESLPNEVSQAIASEVDNEEEQDDAMMPKEEAFPSSLANDKPLSEMSNEELYENAKELEQCGRIKLPVYRKRVTDWWAVKAYHKIYSAHPPFACVPKLRRHLQLTQEDFVRLFRKHGQPVLLYFENLRALGFKTRSFTIPELQELFPYDPAVDKPVEYKANKKFDKDFLDLGPAIYSFKDDGKLVKSKGGNRNYPRNMKVRPSALGKLGVEAPPLVPGQPQAVLQSPSLWFGSSTSPTPMHSDCCDNLVLMLSGTKRFTLAPPTDWHALSPHCIGKHKNLCYANTPDPNAPGVNTDHFNKMVVNVQPGQVLYMPAGTFHAVDNLGPTLMTNIWTRSKETAGIISCNRR